MMQSKIKKITAREFLDSNGRPMVEAAVETEGGAKGYGCAPTGTSVGMYEAKILRDHDPKRFLGGGVTKAVSIVNEVIAPELLAMDVLDQEAIDYKMIALDGTSDKSRLGGNSIYSVSIACLNAAAAVCGQRLYQYLAPEHPDSLPIPTFNMVNGGRYQNLTMAFQEFTVVPYRAECMSEAMNIGVTVFQRLKEMISEYQTGPAMMGHYCGWAPPTDNPIAMMDLLHEAVVKCGYENKVGYALDCASSEMYDPESRKYYLAGNYVEAEQIIDTVKQLTLKYPILYTEDILDENDWDGFTKAVEELKHTIVIGDDLTVTNRARLEQACEKKAAEGFVFKPNQVGTVTESIEAHNYAKAHGMITIPSLRAGGVTGDIVTDLAIGLQVPAMKSGPPRAGERIYAQNRLLRASYDYPDVPLYNFVPLLRHNI